jgi:hypothetical protein
MKQANETPQDATERERLDRLLDAALAATFPASDPVALQVEMQSSPPRQQQVAGVRGPS